MTCRDEILAFVRSLKSLEFGVQGIVAGLKRAGSQFEARTIKTHIVSRLCVNAPAHHAVRYPDFERVGPGVYRLIGSGRP